MSPEGLSAVAAKVRHEAADVIGVVKPGGAVTLSEEPVLPEGLGVEEDAEDEQDQEAADEDDE